MLSIDIPFITICLAGGALLAALLILLILPPRICRVTRAALKKEEETPQALPSVSVIVHARSDASALSLLLPQILGQEYYAPFEVIVVNDGSDESVSNVVAALQPDHRNLYMTFAPARSRNLSRKKLAITLGVKAARYDVLTLLDGNSRLRSPLWLQTMMRHFATGKQIVAGYGYVVPSGDNRLGRLAAFDTLRTALQYLSSALGGRLYRAFGGNVAFMRELFFERKGFSGLLNLRGGHDDMFISSIAHKDNFTVEISQDAMVEVVEENPDRMHRLDKLSHLFTGKRVCRNQQRLWGFCSLLWWGWTGLGIAAIVTGLPSLLPLVAVTLVSLVVCIPLMVAWRKASAALHSRRLTFTVPFFFWIFPFYTVVYRILAARNRSRNYTWGEM